MSRQPSKPRSRGPELPILVTIAILVDSVFFTVLTPLLPSLGRTLGIGPTRLGVLVSMYPLGAFVGAWPSAILASRQGSRRTLVWGLAMLAVSILALGIDPREWLLDASRFLGGVGACCVWTGGLASILQSTPSSFRGRSIAFAMSGYLVGSLVGPLIGGVAFGLGPARVFGAMTALVVLLALSAARVLAPGADSTRGTSLRGLLRDRIARRIFWTYTVPPLLVGILSVLGPIRLDAEGFSAGGIATVFVVAGAAAALAAYPVGHWVDTRGTGRTLRAMLVAAFVASAVLLLDWHASWLGVAICGAGVLYTSLAIPAAAVLAEASEIGDFGFAYGIALGNFAWSLGSVVGSTAAGVSASLVDDRAPFWLASAAALAALVSTKTTSPVAEP